MTIQQFETLASLYYKRFNRLAPGKSEAVETRRESNEPANRRQFQGYVANGGACGAFFDALDRIAELESEVQRFSTTEAE